MQQAHTLLSYKYAYIWKTKQLAIPILLFLFNQAANNNGGGGTGGQLPGPSNGQESSRPFQRYPSSVAIVTQSFCMFRRWEACRCFDDGEDQTRPWFRVRRTRKNGAAVAMHGSGRRATYKIGGCSRKSDYKISGAGGAGVAAIARKQTASGIVLGEDVLTLTVGSEVDHLLVLGMVVVCGLMNRCM